MMIFQTLGRWGFSWICDAGHHSRWMLDPVQPQGECMHEIKCQKCEQTVEVPMQIVS